MAVTAGQIIHDALVALNDHEALYWTLPELLGYLNDARREVVKARPDEAEATQLFTTVAGAKQTIPAGAQSLLNVVRNRFGDEHAITLVDRSMLDVLEPGWASLRRPPRRFVHYMRDPLEPRNFWLYPPAAAGLQIEIVCAMYVEPIDMPEPAPTDASEITAPIGLGDEWKDALLHYVLYRARGKETTETSLARAAAHLELFNRATGAQVAA